MPTPSEALPLEADAVAAAESPPPAHTTCPPETDRVGGWRFDPEEEAQTVEEDGGSSRAPAVNASASANVNVVEPKTAEEDCAIGTEDNRESSNQDETEATSSSMAAVATAPLRSSNTPLAVAVQSRSAQEDREDTPSSQFSSDSDPAASTAREVKISSPTSSARVLPKDASASPKPVSEVIDYKPDALPNYEFSNERLLPSYTSSFLRAGSKFTGTQQSDRQIYNVDVEIKHVDMAESFLCGYLRIQGLTEDHPTLTTYFEGEIIGSKHTFQTRHESWGATDKTDLQHWARFSAWRPLAQQAKKPDFHCRNFAQRENIFMRWKEYFLVPDHRVRTINGASFEGFYYICFNQIQGTVSGIYFHARSEKYQQLELKRVEDYGCMGAMEFR